MIVPYQDLSKQNDYVRNELNEVYANVVNGNWFIRGKWDNRFEKEYAEFCNVKHCIGVGNGLDALRIILQALEIGVGDEVIVPANTFIATVLAITYVGAIPILIDADMATLNVDINQIESKISKKTKAIIAVHLYGRAVQMEHILKIAEKHGLFVIEDAAQAHGARIGKRSVGGFGIASAFSFYPGKNLGALGDAGCIVTDDEILANKMRSIGNYGSEIKYSHVYKGCNSRLDELQAAFLSVKLKHLNKWNYERRQIALNYIKNLDNEKIKIIDISEKRLEENVFHIFPIFSKERDKLQQYLMNKGIETNIHYPIPIPQQLAYKDDVQMRSGSYPVTDQICKEELSIPLYPGMNKEQIDHVVKCINEF